MLFHNLWKNRWYSVAVYILGEKNLEEKQQAFHLVGTKQHIVIFLGTLEGVSKECYL